jgi:hypothetical protein
MSYDLSKMVLKRFNSPAAALCYATECQLATLSEVCTTKKYSLADRRRHMVISKMMAEACRQHATEEMMLDTKRFARNYPRVHQALAGNFGLFESD